MRPAHRRYTRHEVCECMMNDYGSLSISLVYYNSAAVWRDATNGWTKRGGVERSGSIRWVGELVYMCTLLPCALRTYIHAHIYDAPANATTFHTQILYTKHVQARNRVKPALHCTNECFIYDKYLFILFGAFSQSAFTQQLQQHLQQQQQQRILQVHCIVVKFYIVTAARYSWWRIDNIYIFSLYCYQIELFLLACSGFIDFYRHVHCTMFQIAQWNAR